MMYWNGGGWSRLGWLTMTIVMFGFWGLVAWLIVTLARGSSGGGQRSAEDILAERFARGEIDQDEYTSRLNALRSTR